MHICVDCRFLYASGIGRYIKEIISRLIIDKSTKFTLLMYNNDLHKYSYLDNSNINIIFVNGKMYSIKEQFEMALKVPYCDVFWAPHYNIPLFPIKSKRRVVTIHDVNHLVFFNNLSFLQKIYVKFVMMRATRISDRIITVSCFSKDEIIKYTGIKKEKISVTHIGVDNNQFKYYSNAKERFREIYKKYNIPNKFILYIGNIKPHKNINGILKAYSIVKKTYPDIKLVIVGKKDKFITGIPELNENLDSLCIEKDVCFTGFVQDEDLVKFYNLAELFVFPSLYEGFGLPPLEAMACGCATVVSSISSLPEVCADAAYYVDPLNENSIAEGIIHVLQDENLKMSLINKGFIQVKGFNWDQAAKQTMNILYGS